MVLLINTQDVDFLAHLTLYLIDILEHTRKFLIFIGEGRQAHASEVVVGYRKTAHLFLRYTALIA